MTMVQLAAPISGWATPLEEVPDPAFAQKMVGDGIAIDPTSSELRAPCDGVVVSIHDAHHACIVRCREGVEVLLHVGIDTVALRGEGFSPLTRAGQSVRRGDPLIAFDMDIVAKKSRGLFTLMIVVNTDRYAIAERVQGREVAVGEPLLSLTGGPDGEDTRLTASSGPNANASAAKRGESAERNAVLRAPHGLHARPAALIADCAKRYPAVVRVSRQERSANAKSIVALMALGAREGDTLTIRVEGERAAFIAQEIVERVTAGLDESEEAITSTHAPVVRREPVIDLPLFSTGKEVFLQGVPAVAGMAQGSAVRAIRREPELARDGVGAIKERQALTDAILSARRDLEAALEVAPRRSSTAAIIHVHLSILDDPEIAESAHHAIDRGRSAAWAWKAAVERYAAALNGLDDPMLRERATDLRDIESRVLGFLVPSHGSGPAASLPANSILIADELRPSDLVEGARDRLVAICTAGGGPTSHGAILAAGMGIPAVFALGEAILRVPDGAPLIVDGDRGSVRAFPSDGTRRASQDEMRRRAARREVVRRARHRECRTKDGMRIEVLANLGRPGDADNAVANGAEGCGLLRTEFLFLDRNSEPTAEEQRAQYQAVADTLGARPFVIRTLDVGGDKAVPYLSMPREENPALGLRGVRFGLRHPELLRTQIRAILGLRTAIPIRILLPMVSSLAELKAVRAIVETERRALGEERSPLLGAMIEVPIAAVTTDVLAAEVDFFSIGTNDLTQYGAAADRGNPELATFLDGAHPGVLRLVAQAVKGARALGRPVSVCGGIASDARVAALLIGLGVTELSVAASAIPELKAFIATLTLADCTELAERALGLTSADDVRALVNRTWPVV